LAGVTAMDTSVGGPPVPLKLTVCVLPVTLLLLSVMVKEAVRLPVAVGLNVTLNVQLLLAASELPQVLVCPKSPELVPVNPMLAIDRAVLPVLLNVTVWAALVVSTGWLLKVRLEGETPARGALPVPVRLTVWVLALILLELSVMVRVAVRLPVAVGANVTLMVQLVLAATELPHVLVWPKSPLLVPEIAMLLIVSAAFPVLLKVTA